MEVYYLNGSAASDVRISTAATGRHEDGRTERIYNGVISVSMTTLVASYIHLNFGHYSNCRDSDEAILQQEFNRNSHKFCCVTANCVVILPQFYQCHDIL